MVGRMRRSRLVISVAVVAVSAMVASACVKPPPPGSLVTETFQIGPFTLQPGEDLNRFPTNLPRPNGTFGIKEMRFDLVDSAGNSVPRHEVHLHHIVLLNNARSDRVCASWPDRFSGSGSERTPIVLPDPYRYLVGASDRWDALLELVNEMSEPMTVYVQYEITYQPDATAENSRSVTPYFLDIAGCGVFRFTVPGDGGPGSVYTKSRTWTAPANGTAVWVGGHFHEGGIDITLRGPDGPICTAEGMYEDGMLHEISSCPLNEPVSAGASYAVTGRYDNSFQQTGQMGIMLGYVWENG
jgi:hypothetical protein